jgi:hypothetical protein
VRAGNKEVAPEIIEPEILYAQSMNSIYAEHNPVLFGSGRVHTVDRLSHCGDR